MSTTTRWDRVEAGFVESPPAPIGLIVLATDRASGAEPVDGCGRLLREF